MNRPAAPLSDLRVVELGTGAALAFCGKLLADLGARVLKVEPPGGDPLRGYGPFPDGESAGVAGGLFLYLDENKLGATLDLRHEGDRYELARLCDATDVLIEASAPGELEQLGVGSVELRRQNPRLVVTSITPFGQTGPYRDWRAGELGIVHASGLGYETPFNQVEDPERQPPLKPFGHQALMVAGWTAAATTLAALHRRDRTGQGDRIDVSALEAATNLVRPNFAFASHEPPDGSNRLRLAQRRLWGLPWIYRCADGWISIAVIGDAHWQAIREMMGDPEWARSELFGTARGRYQNSDALRPALADWIAGESRERLYREGQARHVPIFPLHGPAELLDNAHLRARRFFRSVAEPALARTVVYPGYPYHWSETPPGRRRAAPEMGTDEREEFLAGEPMPPPAATGAPDDARLPLSGIRVLDFGWVVAVPFATAWLGALGADVVRVESMVHPDPARFLAVAPGAAAVADSSPYFSNLNFSKRSIRLNLAHPRARELALALLPRFDVVAENFTAGTLDRLGLGYQELRRKRDDVILVSVSPLGQTGPEAKCVGWGPNTQAWAGISALTGYAGGPPCGIGGTWPDFTAAVAVVFAILAALRHRNRTGQGQRIDLALAEVILSMLPEAFIELSLGGGEPPRRGNRDPRHAPHDVYRCRGEDSWIAISVEDDREWRALAAAMGRPEWTRCFPSATARSAGADEIDVAICAWTRPQDAVTLERDLQSRGVRALRVRNAQDLLSDAHFVARNLLFSVPHPVTGPAPLLTIPGRFASFDYRYTAAPLIGFDSEQILRDELRLSADEISRLKNEMVIH